EQAVIPKIPEDEVYSLEDAKPGYILMAGGEIVNSSYLAYGGVKGMEPIGIFCFRTGSRKLVLGLDSFYTKEDRYGPGAWPKNEDLKPVSVKPSPDSTGSNRFSCGSSTVKILSAGNQNLILDMIRRGTEEKNLFMDYIKPYGSRIGSSGMELDWQAPTLYEGFLVLCSSTRTRETIKDIIKFFDRIGDDRARILENAGDLIDGTEYILTSSSGQSTFQKTPEYGFWALRRLDQAGEQPDDSRFRELKDQSEQKTLSYKYSPLDFMTDKGIPAEVVLAKPNSDGFRGIAVTYLD
ncbi:MAG: hypothetical protein K6G18_12040, partial [Treponema sp.]|nr:hypothetical protein [Treponema sp.]